MAYLLDTNILVRLANAADPFHTVADRAVMELHGRGELLYVAPQILVELRSAATRPTAANGLGLAAPEAEAKAAGFEAAFPLLPETVDIYPAWKLLVTALGVVGKRVFDARLVAICNVHKVTHLLTFNVADFASLAAFGPGVVVVHPGSV